MIRQQFLVIGWRSLSVEFSHLQIRSVSDSRRNILWKSKDETLIASWDICSCQLRLETTERKTVRTTCFYDRFTARQLIIDIVPPEKAEHQAPINPLIIDQVNDRRVNQSRLTIVGRQSLWIAVVGSWGQGQVGEDIVLADMKALSVSAMPPIVRPLVPRQINSLWEELYWLFVGVLNGIVSELVSLLTIAKEMKSKEGRGGQNDSHFKVN